MNHKIAIVTGVSRTQGIGAAICRELASKEIDLFFTHWISYDVNTGYENIQDNWPEEFTNELLQYGIKVASMELDLSEDNAPIKLLNHVESRLGLPCILINNATHCVEVGFRELTSEILDDHCKVNVRGTCLLATEFAKRLEGNNIIGRIINLVSGQDKGPMPGNLAYVATKGAISAFTVSLAAELAPHGITVNAIDPGPTDTGWMSEELKEYLIPKFPMGRLGVSSDASRLISFLVSDEAQWITGQIIHSDGGFRD